ncbi:MAG: IS1 family transposase [Bacteroidetes bacterium]|nr:IS1 family transposase [Bacteroidota bacterium]
MKHIECPKCKSQQVAKSGVVKGRQRYHCKECKYFFTVLKEGRKIDPYYVIKALQLHIEGVSFREIERILGISHVSVMNWVKTYGVKAPENNNYHPTYQVLNQEELIQFFAGKDALKNAGCIVTELGDKFMLIKWERFRKNSF